MKKIRTQYINHLQRKYIHTPLHVRSCHLGRFWKKKHKSFSKILAIYLQVVILIKISLYACNFTTYELLRDFAYIYVNFQWLFWDFPNSYLQKRQKKKTKILTSVKTCNQFALMIHTNIAIINSREK